MMTPEQKLRELWEAVGNCWHIHIDNDVLQYSYCSKCNALVWTTHHQRKVDVNPNPTLTLDCLFEIARKNDISRIDFQGDRVVIKDGHKEYTGHFQGSELGELALLDALYQAIKDK